MEPGPTVPAAGPQRGNQHHPGQPGLDGSPRERAFHARPGRHPADTPHPAARHERQRLIGQRAGVLRHVRTEPAARHGHARPGIVQRQEPHQRRPEGILRIPLHPDGAMGRAGRPAVQRRALCRRDARPQRPPSGPLPHHEKRHDGRGQRSGGHPLRAGRHQGKRTAPAGQDPAGGHAGRPHLLRWRAEGAAGLRQALPPVAVRQPHRAGHPAERTESGKQRAGLRPAAPHLRLHPRGHRTHPHAHGRKRGGTHGLHGKRHAAGRAVGQAAAVVQLLPAAIRPGDEPGHRPHPRGTGHVAHRIYRGRGHEHPATQRDALQDGAPAPSRADQHAAGHPLQHPV